MAEMLQRRPGPQGHRDRGPEAARQSYAYPPGPAAPGTFQPAHGPCVPPLPPIGLTAAGLFDAAKVSRIDSRVR